MTLLPATWRTSSANTWSPGKAKCGPPLPFRPPSCPQAASLLVFSSVLMVVGSVGALGDLGYDSLKRLWGFTANGGEWVLGVWRAGPPPLWRLRHAPVG